MWILFQIKDLLSHCKLLMKSLGVSIFFSLTKHVSRVVGILLRIWEVPSSNLDPEVCYADKGFRSFPQSRQAMSFPIHYTLIILSFNNP
jgi:hypothetical protein